MVNVLHWDCIQFVLSLPKRKSLRRIVARAISSKCLWWWESSLGFASKTNIASKYAIYFSLLIESTSDTEVSMKMRGFSLLFARAPLTLSQEMLGGSIDTAFCIWATIYAPNWALIFMHIYESSPVLFYVASSSSTFRKYFGAKLEFPITNYL